MNKDEEWEYFLKIQFWKGFQRGIIASYLVVTPIIIIILILI